MISLITIIIFSQLDHFGFDNISSPQIAGTPFQITIRAYDSGGGNYPYNGWANIYTSWDDPANPRYCNETVQFSNGVWTGDVTVSLAADTMSLICDDRGGHTGSSNQFQVRSNIPTQLLSVLPGQMYTPGLSPGRANPPAPQTAGVDFAIDIYLTDNWFNTVDTANHLVRVTSTDSFVQQLQIQLQNGITTDSFSFRTAGARHHLYFNDMTNTSIKPDTSSEIAVYPGSYAALLAILPGETHLPGDSTSSHINTPGKSNEPDDQYVDSTFIVIVYATDTMWNRTSATGFPIQLFSDFPFSNPAPETLNNGEVQFSISFPQAEDNTPVWARDNMSFIESYRNRVDILGFIDTSVVPDSFIVYPNPLGIEANRMYFKYYLQGSCNLIFAIYDPFGNLVYEQRESPGGTGAQAGLNTLMWDGRNTEGRRVASGVYYVVLKGWTHTTTIFNKTTKVGVVW